MTSHPSRSYILSKQLMMKLRCRKDGILAESMQAKEDQIIAAWGVSMMHVKEVMRSHYGDHSLAFELLQQPMREARLGAAFLFDGMQLSPQEIEHILPFLITTELVEQFSMRVFPIILESEAFFVRLLDRIRKGDVSLNHSAFSSSEISSDRMLSLYQRAALLSLGRIWRKTDKMTHEEADTHLALLLCATSARFFQTEDALSFAVDGLLGRFPPMTLGLTPEMEESIKKLTLLNYGTI